MLRLLRARCGIGLHCVTQSDDYYHTSSCEGRATITWEAADVLLMTLWPLIEPVMLPLS